MESEKVIHSYIPITYTYEHDAHEKKRLAQREANNRRKKNFSHQSIEKNFHEIIHTLTPM